MWLWLSSIGARATGGRGPGARDGGSLITDSSSSSSLSLGARGCSSGCACACECEAVVICCCLDFLPVLRSIDDECTATAAGLPWPLWIDTSAAGEEGNGKRRGQPGVWRRAKWQNPTGEQWRCRRLAAHGAALMRRGAGSSFALRCGRVVVLRIGFAIPECAREERARAGRGVAVAWRLVTSTERGGAGEQCASTGGDTAMRRLQSRTQRTKRGRAHGEDASHRPRKRMSQACKRGSMQLLNQSTYDHKNQEY